MLSVVRSSTSGQHFAVFVVGNIFDGFNVKITNGHELFHHDGVIKEETHKPQSRSKESKISYMTTLHSALTTTTISSTHNENEPSGSSASERFIHDFNVNTADDSIQLVIKERLENTATMSILLRTSFTKQYSASAPLPSMTSAIMDLFLELQVNVSTKQHTIDCLERDNKRHQELNDNYVKDIKLLNDLKDNLQDTMIQRMCLILNSKKIELQRLQDRIEELESALGGGGKSDGNNGQALVSQSQNQVLPTVAKRGRKKAEPVAATTKKTPAARKTATSVDTIQKRTAASKAKSATKASSAKSKGGRKKRGKDSESEDEDEEENSEDREFIADEDEKEDNSSEGSSDSESSSHQRRRKKNGSSSERESEGSDLDQRKSSSTKKSNIGTASRIPTQSFLTQKHATMEIDSADIMNFLSHKNGKGLTQMSRGNSLTDSNNHQGIEIVKKENGIVSQKAKDWEEIQSSSAAVTTLEATGATRRGKRSSALLSQDDQDEFRSNVHITKSPAHFPKEKATTSSSFNNYTDVADSKTMATSSTTSTAAMPAAKKKRSERFFDSDDEGDGCLDFL